MDVEIWKDVVGYEGKYQVSNCGRVKSLPFLTYSGAGRQRKVTPKILKNNNCPYGYYKVNLSGRTYKVHTLVAEAFIPKPDTENQSWHGWTVNHKDGDKKNNLYSNLEWITMGENLKHAIETGLNRGALGENNPMNKLSLKDVVDIKVALLLGRSVKEIAKFYKVCESNIYFIKAGERWSHIRVEKEGDDFVLYDQQTKEQEAQGELKTVFLNGNLVRETSLTEIRNLLWNN